MFEVDHAKFEEGRAAYVRGASVRGLAEAVEREYQASQQEGVFDRTHEIAGKSLMLGFLDGLVSDIRKIAGSARSGTRA